MTLRRSGLLACAVVALSATLLVTQQQDVVAAGAQDGPAMVVVYGLAPNDLLNIRATTSPTGLLIGRVPNGTLMTRTACESVNKYVWCKVTAANDPKVSGWTPQRYLMGGEPLEAPPAVETPVAEKPAEALVAERPVAEKPLAAPAPVEAAPAPMTVKAPAQIASIGMVAIGANDLRDIRATTRPTGLLTGRVPTDMMMTSTSCGTVRKYDWCKVSTANEPSPRDLTPQVAALDGVGAGGTSTFQPEDSRADAGAAFGTIPIPTPRPDIEAAESPTASQLVAAIEPVAPAQAAEIPAPARAADIAARMRPAREEIVFPSPDPVAAEGVTAPVQTLAAVPSVEKTAAVRTVSASPAQSFDAVGEIPCARYVGQPMMRCDAGVVRTGEGAAQITVTWPDGGRRIIQFRDGKPELTNARSELRYTREADLNMIRVGMGERFEIPDTLPFGD